MLDNLRQTCSSRHCGWTRLATCMMTVCFPWSVMTPSPLVTRPESANSPLLWRVSAWCVDYTASLHVCTWHRTLELFVSFFSWSAVWCSGWRMHRSMFAICPLILFQCMKVQIIKSLLYNRGLLLWRYSMKIVTCVYSEVELKCTILHINVIHVNKGVRVIIILIKKKYIFRVYLTLGLV